MNTLSITKIDFLDDHIMQILLNNHKLIRYDISPKFNTTRFVELRDPTIFKQGRLIGHKIIRWSPYMEITLDEILLQNSTKVSEE